MPIVTQRPCRLKVFTFVYALFDEMDRLTMIIAQRALSMWVCALSQDFPQLCAWVVCIDEKPRTNTMYLHARELFLQPIVICTADPWEI